MVFKIDCGICELFGLLRKIGDWLVICCISVGNWWCNCVKFMIYFYVVSMK